MECPRCGRRASPGDIECIWCGARLPWAPKPASPRPARRPPQPPPPQAEPQPRRSPRTRAQRQAAGCLSVSIVLLILGLVLFLLAPGVGLLLLLAGGIGWLIGYTQHLISR